MEIKRKLAKLSPLFQSAAVIAISALFVFSAVYAATTIGASITTGGNLTVTGHASSTSATTTKYLMVGSGFSLPAAWNYNEDLAVSGDAMINGNATTTGHYNFGSATEYIRVELEPYRPNSASGNIPWLKGRSLNAAGGIGVFGAETGLFITGSGDATYSEPVIIFIDNADAELSRVYGNSDDDSMIFANAAGGYSFDDTMSIGGTAAADVGLSISENITGSGANPYGLSMISSIAPENGYSAYGAFINPTFGLAVGNTYPVLANLYVDGGSTGVLGGTATDYYGLYVDKPLAAGASVATNIYGAYIEGTTLLDGNASTTGDLFVSGGTFDLTTSTGTTTPGIFSQSLARSTSTISAGVITNGSTKKSVGCLELAATNGAYYSCFIDTATPSLVSQLGRCN